MSTNAPQKLRDAQVIAQSDFDTAKANYDAAAAQVAADQSNLESAAARCCIKPSSIWATPPSFRPSTASSSRAAWTSARPSPPPSRRPRFSSSPTTCGTCRWTPTWARPTSAGSPPGMPATFTVDAYPGKQFIGNAASDSQRAQTLQNVVTYDAVIDVENPNLLLRPGMTANVHLRRRAKEQRRALAQCRAALSRPIRSFSRASASPIRRKRRHRRRKTPIARRFGCCAMASRCACRFHRRFRRHLVGARGRETSSPATFSSPI